MRPAMPGGAGAPAGESPAGAELVVMESVLIVTGLQAIVSRQMDLTKAPAVVTTGWIDGGVRAMAMLAVDSLQGDA